MPVKMAIIGMGGMAGWHHDNIKDRLPAVEVVGAFDIREEAKKTIESKGLKSYPSAEALIADKDIDVVLIATPNDVHKAYAIACMEAGKNVICEKPVTMNTAELDEIAAVAQKTGRLFTVHQNRRWDADYLTVRKILEDGLLHGLYRIETRVQGSRLGIHGWRGYKINGGGMVLDWGVHLLDQMLYMIPEKVVSVYADLHKIAPEVEVDDDFTATLRFESGLVAVVNVSMSSFVPQPRWHLFCKDGSAVVKNWELDGEIVKLANPDELDWSEDIVYTAAGPTRSMAPRPKHTTETLPLPKTRGDWLDFHRNVADVLAGKAEPIVTIAQARRVMRVIDTIFESSEKGTSITCSI